MDAVKFNKVTFKKRLSSMLCVDIRRMLKSRVFYIIIACALIVPIVMTVMLVMMDGQESVNQQTGEVTIMEGPESVWESIGTLPSDGKSEADMSAGMDVMAMCNINMAFMGVCVFVALFVCDDFRSGYAKNLFTVRAKRGEYVVSKIFVGFICGALMVILYFLGAMIAGAIMGLSFDLGSLNTFNIVCCILSKVFLMLVFVPIFVTLSIASKQKTWLAICLSLGCGMLLFMMVGMITPLGSTLMNVILCIAGGALFSFGLGTVAKTVLRKSSVV